METNELGLTEILAPQTTDISIPPALDPDLPTQPLTVSSNLETLEDLMLRAYMDTLRSSTGKVSDRLKAAQDVAKMIGKSGGSAGGVTLVKSDNVQINQFNDKPELLDHLKRAGQGITAISSATPTDFHIQKAGRGE